MEGGEDQRPHSLVVKAFARIAKDRGFDPRWVLRSFSFSPQYYNIVDGSLTAVDLTFLVWYFLLRHTAIFEHSDEKTLLILQQLVECSKIVV